MKDVQAYRDLAEQFTQLADGMEKGDALFTGRIILITETLRVAGWDVIEEPCTSCTATRKGCDQARIKCCPDCTHGQMVNAKVPS